MSRNINSNLRLELDYSANPYIDEKIIRTNLFKFIENSEYEQSQYPNYGIAIANDYDKYNPIDHFAVQQEEYYSETEEVLIPFIYQSNIYYDVIFTLYIEERYYSSEQPKYLMYKIQNNNVIKYVGIVEIHYVKQ